MRLEYPAPFAVGDSTIIPMGPSPLAASSQVTKSTPLLAYACEARIFGTSVDNLPRPPGRPVAHALRDARRRYRAPLLDDVLPARPGAPPPARAADVLGRRGDSQRRGPGRRLLRGRLRRAARLRLAAAGGDERRLRLLLADAVPSLRT